MKTPHAYILGAVIILMTGGTALGQIVGNEPESKPLAGKPTTSISLSAYRDSVNLGAPVTVIVTLTNTSNEDIVVDRLLSGADSKIEVRDLNGDLLPDSHFGYFHNGHVPQSQIDWSRVSDRDLTDSAVSVTVKAGQTTKWSFVANKFYDISKPGKYTIRIERLDPGDRKTFEKSNTITVTVTP